MNGNFSSNGNLLFEIGGAQNTGLYDLLTINSGSAIFAGGNIEFAFIDNYTAKAGAHWDFLRADSILGWDTLSVTLTGLSPGLGWELKHFKNRVRLVITHQKKN